MAISRVRFVPQHLAYEDSSTVFRHKIRVSTNVLFSLAALLMFASASGAAQTVTTSSLTVLHFASGGDDTPGRMTTDAAGNFYIAAGSNIGQGFFEVLKYNLQNKLTVIRHPNQPGEFGGLAVDVKLDKLGNIYAVGSTTFGGLVASFTPTGSQRWATHFNGTPVAVAVDGLGNVYAAGTRETGNFQGEWVIIKYSNSGLILWEQHHTGTVARSDVRLTDIRLDSAGNPVLLGITNMLVGFFPSTMTTLKLDSHGNTLWVDDFDAGPHAQVNPRGLALDRADSVYATGATGPFSGFGFTVKYDANGSRQFLLSGNESGGVSVTIDPAGDLLLVGSMAATQTPLGVNVVSKYHVNGVKVWTTTIPAAGKILSDAIGNIFVAGSTPNSNINPTTEEYFVSKLSPTGKLQFTKSFPQGQDVSDAVFDSLGNLFVTRSLINSPGTHEIVTLKLAKGFTAATAQ